MRLKMISGEQLAIYKIEEVSVVNPNYLKIVITADEAMVSIDSVKECLVFYDFGKKREFEVGVKVIIDIGNRQYLFEKFSHEEIKKFIDGENGH